MEENSNWSSRAQGFLDAAYNAVRERVQPAEERWFSKGYGEIEDYYTEVDSFMEKWAHDGLEGLKVPVHITWRKMAANDHKRPHVWRDEGTFESPLAHKLPRQSQSCRCLFVRGAPGSGVYPPTRSIVVHMAATGTSTYTDREQELAMPLLLHGIASLIIMAPFNGSRRPAGQTRHYIQNVADYMLQSLAIILEGAALLRTIEHGGLPPPRPGETYEQSLTSAVLGLSWGGAMAACAALVSQVPTACMVGLGSDSPRVMATGALQWQLDWAALAAGSHCTKEVAKSDLIEVFTRITFATVLARAPRRDTLVSVVQVGARDDWYVDAAESRQLFDSLRHAVAPLGWCRFEWIDGGHAAAFLRQRAIFVPACVEAVNAAQAHRAKQAVDTGHSVASEVAPVLSHAESGSWPLVRLLVGIALPVAVGAAVMVSQQDIAALW